MTDTDPADRRSGDDRLAEENDLLRAELERSRAAIADLRGRLEAARRQAEEAEKQQREVVEELGLAKLIVDRSPVVLFRRTAERPDGKPTLQYVSDNLRRFGYDPRDFIEERIRFKEIVHPDDDERLIAEINRYADEDVEEYTQYYRILTRDGEVRWVEDQTSVVRDGQGNKIFNQGILVDITERKRAEEKLARSEEKFRRIVETAGEGFILMDQDMRIVDINEAGCQLLGYNRGEVIGREPDEFASDESRSFLAANRELLLARERRTFEAELITREGRIVPVQIHGNVLRDDHGAVIGNMAFITDLSDHKKALALAGEVQKNLLPLEMPRVEGLDIAGRNVSCDEIGGDYYDFIWRPGAHHEAISIVVGDISGHGVDSALLMTTARAFLRMRASQPGSIGEIVTAMNSHLARDVLETGNFMTLFCLTIEPANRRLEWVRAGHDPALVYHPDRDGFEELKGDGIALGVSDGFTYEENSRNGLDNGNIIAIGTDGIWEAFNMAGEMFGKRRFQEIIRRHAHDGAETILNAVYDELKRFTVGRRAEDDVTLVIVKVDGLRA